MKLQSLIAVSLSIGSLIQTGCVTTQSTKGFQTNPPVKNSQSFPHDFADGKEPNAMQKFFAVFKPKKQQVAGPNGDMVPAERDATSLQSPGTVSAELLIVAGEMGLEQERFDLAASYFQRALKMEPNNARALGGLAKAKAGRGGTSPVSNGQLEQRTGKQLDPRKSFGNTERRKAASMDQGVQLVSYVEEEADEPASISVETKAAVNRAVEVDADVAVASEMTLMPAIHYSAPQLARRVANPFFGTQDSIAVDDEMQAISDVDAGHPESEIVDAEVVDAEIAETEIALSDTLEESNDSKVAEEKIVSAPREIDDAATPEAIAAEVIATEVIAPQAIQLASTVDVVEDPADEAVNSITKPSDLQPEEPRKLIRVKNTIRPVVKRHLRSLTDAVEE